MLWEHFKGSINTGDINTKYDKYTTASFIIGFTVTVMAVILMIMYWVL